MKSLTHATVLTCLLAALLGAGNAGAQAPEPAAAPVPGSEPVDTLVRAGLVEGTTSAQAESTAFWTLGGFAGGLTLGPIGAGLAYALAESSPSALPQAVASRNSRKSTGYALAYQQAFTERLIRRRKRATLVGSAAGTALLVVGTVGMYLRLQ